MQVSRGSYSVSGPSTSANVFKSRRNLCVIRKSAGELGNATATATHVTLLNNRDEFKDLISNQKDKILLVDYYTTWCGPCKLIAPEIEKMAAEYEKQGKGVKVAKVCCDASNDNKKWAMDVQIKSLPTFRLYKGGQEEHCGQVTGTKVAALKALIEEELSKLN